MDRIKANRIDIIVNPSAPSQPIEIAQSMQYNAATDSFSPAPSAASSPPKAACISPLDRDTPFERFCGWLGHFFDEQAQ